MRDIDLEERLAERIVSGEARPGERLPDERDLAREFGVGRLAVREALGSLARRGLITRGEHRAAYVSRPKVEHDLRAITSFSANMERAGLAPTARLVEASVVVAPARVAAALELDASARVARVERVLSASRLALTVAEAWLPADLYPDITELGLTGSLYALMRECYALGPVRAVERLEAVPARARDAELLGVAEGAPLMLVERTSYAQDGTPVEYARERHRGDRASFVAESAPVLPVA